MCWTVQALIWIWLVYPFVARTLKRWSVGWDPKAFCVALVVGGVTLIWGVMMIICAIWGPYLLNEYGYPGQGNRHYGKDNMVFHTFPVFVFAPFLGGVVAAEAILTAKPADHWTWGVMCDITFLLWMALLALQGLSLDVEFSDYGYMGLMSVLLLTSSITSKSLVVRLTNHPLLIKLGDYSFHIYLLQLPVFMTMNKTRKMLGMTGYEFPYLNRNVAALKFDAFCANLVVLLISSVLVSDIFEAPYVSFLKSWTKQRATKFREEKKAREAVALESGNTEESEALIHNPKEVS